MDNKTFQEKLQDQLQDPNKNITLIVYGLQLIGVLTGGIAFIVAIVLNYIKRDDVAGTFLESHFEWQIRTFWTSLIWGIVGFVMAITIFLLPAAWIIWFVVMVWVIYRAIKGLLNLLENKPMPSKVKSI
ncbi:MAG: hypothetical protein PHI79_04380 [Sulfurovaceae bacterium]|nr:hypothetical protein [Sulfurovaceae bacterium]MDD5548820.1 hypothetical protein [Sulfurovaceae bacterium]